MSGDLLVKIYYLFLKVRNTKLLMLNLLPAIVKNKFLFNSCYYITNKFVLKVYFVGHFYFKIYASI